MPLSRHLVDACSHDVDLTLIYHALSFPFSFFSTHCCFVCIHHVSMLLTRVFCPFPSLLLHPPLFVHSSCSWCFGLAQRVSDLGMNFQSWFRICALCVRALTHRFSSCAHVTLALLLVSAIQSVCVGDAARRTRRRAAVQRSAATATATAAADPGGVVGSCTIRSGSTFARLCVCVAQYHACQHGDTLYQAPRAHEYCRSYIENCFDFCRHFEAPVLNNYAPHVQTEGVIRMRVMSSFICVSNLPPDLVKNSE